MPDFVRPLPMDANREASAQTITTRGYELVDVDVAIDRAITGGTGDYQMERGRKHVDVAGT